MIHFRYHISVLTKAISLLFLLYTCFINAQNQDFYPFTVNYSTKDGLPSNETYVIVEDHKGYIWIGTDRGVVRYNGYEFEVFTTEDGLPDNVVFKIQVDDEGKIWFFPMNSEIFYYEYGKGFKKFKFNNNIKPHLEKDYIVGGFKKDAQGNFYLWNLFKDYAVLKITPSGEVDPFKRENYTHTSVFVDRFNDVDILHTFRTGNRKTKDRKKVHYWLGEKVGEFNIKRILTNEIYFFNDNKDTIYICSGKHMSVLTPKNIINTTFETEILPVKIKSGYVVGYRDPKTNKHSVYWQKSLYKPSTKTELINGIQLTYALQDSSGGIWLTSHEKGIFYIPNIKNKVSGIDNSVDGLIPIKEHIYFYKGNQSYKIKNRTHTIKKLSVKEMISFNDLKYDFAYPQSRKLYGPMKTQIISKNFTYRNDETIFPAYTYHKSNKKERITAMSYWLYNYFYVKDSVYIKKGFDRANRLIVFEYDFNDDIWVGTISGLFKYHGDTIFRPAFNFGKIYDRVQDIKFWKETDLSFIATLGNGIYVTRADTLVKHIKQKDNLTGNSINQLFISENKHLWIATNKGFNYLDLTDPTLSIRKVLISPTHLRSPNVKQLFVKDSIIYLGTDSGVHIIDWKAYKKIKRSSMPVYIDHVLINQKPHHIGAIKGKGLSYKQNNITISFLGLAHSHLKDINYRYRLIKDNPWIYTQSRKIDLVSLQPGAYNFELEATDDFGDWVPAKETLPFYISKPYWDTWWFILCVIILIVAGITSLFIYYLRNKKRQETMQMQLNVTKQMAFSSQLNPHFLFNSLSSVQNFILKNEPLSSSNYLGKFAVLIRTVFENSKKTVIPLHEEIKTIKTYLDLETLRFKNGFDYTINLDERLDLGQYYIPPFLFQPIIENAIWHGLLPKKENRLLEISITELQDQIKFIIKDNGVGRKNKDHIKTSIRWKKKESSGISLTKKRLDILSKLFKEKTQLKIRDLYDKDDQNNGTEVAILIPKIKNP